MDTNWKLDSLVCFNVTNDKCIMAFMVQYGKDVSNGINYYYGVKINEKWFFFRGPHIYIPNSKKALPFPTLHEIAMQEVFSGYLKKKDKGFWGNLKQEEEWEINEEFFDQLDYNKWGFFDKKGNLIDNSKLSQHEIDSLLLDKAVYSNWKNRDTTNYDKNN
jgi:hypothetical protein